MIQPISENERVVRGLYEQNHAFYSTPDGQASLKAFANSVDEEWTYVFELMQNAIDAKAKRISLRPRDKGFSFQHDGSDPLDAKSVTALCKLFQSTKRAATVGFMGIGFKSVFQKYERISVSGWGWQFHFEVPFKVGGHGQLIKQVIGAVLPIWDTTVPAPDPGFTTRFEMSGARGECPPSDDIQHLLDHDGTVLALLARSGLERLRIGDTEYVLRVAREDGSEFVTASLGDRARSWRVLAASYTPPLEGVRAFLEKRLIADETEDDIRAASRPREVVGVIPYDDAGNPKPPSAGRVFSTLPTQVTVPFRMHVQADWFLNQSRTGLTDLSTNPWQKAIVDGIAALLANYLRWVGSRQLREADSYRQTLVLMEVLQKPEEGSGPMAAELCRAGWKERLTRLLADVAFLPCYVKGALRFLEPSKVARLPKPLGDRFDSQPDRRADLLFLRPVLATQLLGRGTKSTLDWLGFAPFLKAESVPVDGASLEAWWTGLGGDDARHAALLDLWDATLDPSLKDLGWVAMRWVPTEAGTWVRPSDVRSLAETISEKEELADRVLEFLAPIRPGPEESPRGNLLASLIKRGGAVKKWFDTSTESVDLSTAFRKAFQREATSDAPRLDLAIAVGQWAKHRNRSELISYVVVDGPGERTVVPVGEALLVEPYVADGSVRRRIYRDAWPIVEDYVTRDPFGQDAAAWADAFKQIAKGPLRFVSKVETFEHWRREDTARAVGAAAWSLPAIKRGDFEVIDDAFPFVVQAVREDLAAYLTEECLALDGRGKLRIPTQVQGFGTVKGSKVSEWVNDLWEAAWVWSSDQQFHRPAECLTEPDPDRPDAPVAALAPSLVKMLAKEGITFGEKVPKGTPVPTGQVATPPIIDLRRLIAEKRGQLERATSADIALPVLRGIPFEHPVQGRVHWDRLAKRVGRNARSSLDGWIVTPESFPKIWADLFLNPWVQQLLPETTTGAQALAYLESVWGRAANGEDGLATAVREILPSAYDAVLVDEVTHPSLRETFNSTRAKAYVFADREWVAIRGERSVCLNDLSVTLPLSVRKEMALAAEAHLGSTMRQARYVAERLGLPVLSQTAQFAWEVGKPIVADAFARRFGCVMSDLERLGNGDQDPRLLQVQRIDGMTVRVGNQAVRMFVRFGDGIECTVAGSPRDFAPDLAEALTTRYLAGQSGVVGRLSNVLAALEDCRRFEQERSAFREHFGLGPIPSGELENRPPERGSAAMDGITEGSQHSLAEPPTADDVGSTNAAAAIAESVSGLRPTLSGELEIGQPVQQRVATDGIAGEGNPRLAQPHSYDTGGTQNTPAGFVGGASNRHGVHEKASPPTRSNPLTVLRSLVRLHADEDVSESESRDPNFWKPINAAAIRRVMEHETAAGRVPTEMPHMNPGYDIVSRDGSGALERFIEVKGLRGDWDFVRLKPAQFRFGLDNRDLWWLYVVERAESEDFQIHRIQDLPRRVAEFWVDGEWRKVVDAPDGGGGGSAGGEAMTTDAAQPRRFGEPRGDKP